MVRSPADLLNSIHSHLNGAPHSGSQQDHLDTGVSLGANNESFTSIIAQHTNSFIPIWGNQSSQRKFLVGGNFKMNGSKASIKEIVDRLNTSELASNVDVVIAPPAPYLAYASDLVTKSSVYVSAQNCFDKDSGAYTGEISPDTLKNDLGINWVILGHSERRAIIKESDEFIASKTKFALDKGLKVILCIGETFDEKNAGETLNVCKRQLKPVIDLVKDWTDVVIAYEPVWAIGTGLAATAQDAQDIHKSIREYLASELGSSQAEKIRILYGGSVNGKNAGDFKDKVDVDGFLVGGASLKPEFVDIINSRN